MADPTYRGINFPFRKGTTSFPKEATDAELIRQSITQIVMTTPGERVMRPDFGCRAISEIFENQGGELEGRLRTEIVSAISRHEPRATVSDIVFEREDNVLSITIFFVVNLLQEQQSVTLNVATPQ